MRRLLLPLVVAAGLSASPRSALAQESVALPKRGAPQVHVETDNPNVILFRWGTAQEWWSLGPTYRDVGVPVCRAPCDQVVDGSAGQVFFFAGNGVRPSETFSLRRRDGYVNIDVQAGHPKKRGAAYGLFALGGLGVAVGIPLVAVSLPQSVDRGGSANWVGIGGGIAIGVGVAIILAGVAVVADSSSRTVVTEATEARVRIEPSAGGLAVRF
jgi:hypothetical protein